MDNSCQIRKAGPDDVPALLSLYAQLGQDDGSVLSREDAAALLARIATYPDYQIRLALLDGRAVGTLALLVMDNLAHAGSRSAVVEDVVVDASVRGRGIGRLLMEDAMGIARAKGCYKIVLNSNDNRQDAHRFYRTLGYRTHGTSFFVPLETPDA